MIQNRMRMQGRIKPMLKTCRSMILNHKLQMINPKRNLMRRRKSQLNKSNTSHQQVQALLSCRQLHQHSLLNNQTHNLKNQKRRKKKVLPPNSQLNNQQHQVGCLHSHSWAQPKLLQIMKVNQQLIMNRIKPNQHRMNNSKRVASQHRLLLVLVLWIAESYNSKI